MTTFDHSVMCFLTCIIHENHVFIHKHFKAKGFEISTRPQKSLACSRFPLEADPPKAETLSQIFH